MTEKYSEMLGLDAEAVRARVAEGRVNRALSRPSRTTLQILRGNIFTRFNAILGGLLVIVAIVGPPQDGLFGVVLTVNAGIGIIQEIRAKRALDRLALVNAPIAHIKRDGIVSDFPAEFVVEDDILALRPGDQIVADAIVIHEAGLQIDESLLTGEALPVDRHIDDEVLSGSIVVSGSGYARAVRVGANAYAQRLQIEAKQFAIASSELQKSTNRLLRVISWMIVPIAGVLATSQLLRSHISRDDALRATVAGIGAMVPEGLVLLTTMAFALGALRLAQRNVLVQSLPAIEGLARVDIVCIDKTGTLTEQGTEFDHLIAFKDGLDIVLGCFSAADPAPNATMKAISEAFPIIESWDLNATVPFSSDRKWSAAEFRQHETWFLGAPDVLFQHIDESESIKFFNELRTTQMIAGKRVLALAQSRASLHEPVLPSDLRPMGIIVLSEKIRIDASATVAFLQMQGVTLKVLSGDDPRTVAQVAATLKIASDHEPVDARFLPEDPTKFDDLIEQADIFGRVRPEQKRDIIASLQARGHVIAMTGDGVNDVPALKQADVGIAMGTGSQASRSVANIVLLTSAFASVPNILNEGRRVINNIERVANLFVTKTVYASLLAITVGIIAIPYPFYPRQLTIVSSLTIGIPGFFLALAPGAPRAQPNFLRRVMRFSTPAGVGAAVATLATYAITRGPQHASTQSAKTAATITLLIVALFVLAMLARPLNWQRILLVVLMFGGAVGVITIPISRRIFALSLPSFRLFPTILISATVMAAGIWSVLGILDFAAVRSGTTADPHPFEPTHQLHRPSIPIRWRRRHLQ